MIERINAYEMGEVEGFVIGQEDSGLAEWAIKKIKEEEAERDRLIDICKEEIKVYESKIEGYKERTENKTSFLKNALANYFALVDHKKTKTQESVELPSGKLVWKFPCQKMNPNKEELLKALQGTEFIKTTEEVKWAEYKKNLAIVGDKVIDTTTGEAVDAVSVEQEEGRFEIK